MRMLITSEIEHPPGVCPQFVVSGIERVGQGERPMCRSVFHLQLLPFHEIAVRCEQFHVHDFAQVCEPPLVAHEVAGVVDMEVHFLLRQACAETFHAGSKGIHGCNIFMALRRDVPYGANKCIK